MSKCSGSLGCENSCFLKLQRYTKMGSMIMHSALVIHRQDMDISLIHKVFSIRGIPSCQKILPLLPDLLCTMFTIGKISPKKAAEDMNIMLGMVGLRLFPHWDLLKKCLNGHGQIIYLSSPYGFLAYIPTLKESK